MVHMPGTNLLYAYKFEADLQENEKLIWTGKPELIPFFVFGIIILIFSVFFSVNKVVQISQNNESIHIGGTFFFFWLSVINILRLRRIHRNTYYGITDKRLLIKTGFLGIDFKEIDFAEIQEAKVVRNFLEKKYDAGTILIFTGLTDYNNFSPEFLLENITSLISRNVMVSDDSINGKYKIYYRLKSIKHSADIVEKIRQRLSSPAIADRLKPNESWSDNLEKKAAVAGFESADLRNNDNVHDTSESEPIRHKSGNLASNDKQSRLFKIISKVIFAGGVILTFLGLWAKFTAAGWLMVFGGFFAYPLIALAHLYYNSCLLTGARQLNPPMLVLAFLSHIFIFLAFLLQIDIGDSTEAWAAVAGLLGEANTITKTVNNVWANSGFINRFAGNIVVFVPALLTWQIIKSLYSKLQPQEMSGEPVKKSKKNFVDAKISAMLDSFLEKNEKIVWTGKSHETLVLAPHLVFLFLTVFLSFFLYFTFWRHNPVIFLFPIVSALNIMRLRYIQPRKFYAISGKRLIFKDGPLGRTLRELKYSNILEIYMEVNPLEAVLKRGTIRIFLGKYEVRGRKKYEKLKSIANPYFVFKLIKESLKA